MDVYDVNMTVRPEGLCKILLVFGTILRLIGTIPSPSKRVQATGIYQTMNAVRKEQNKRRIQFGLRDYGGSEATEDNNKLSYLTSGTNLLVYHSTSKLWEVPHIFVSEVGEISVVQTNEGRKIFLSQCVRNCNNMKIIYRN